MHLFLTTYPFLVIMQKATHKRKHESLQCQTFIKTCYGTPAIESVWSKREETNAGTEPEPEPESFDPLKDGLITVEELARQQPIGEFLDAIGGFGDLVPLIYAYDGCDIKMSLAGYSLPT